MTSVTLDRETLASLSERLDRVADELPDAERSQLRALLAVGSSEVARLAGFEAPGGEQVDILGGGFHEALHPLTGAVAPREVEPFDATPTPTPSGSSWSFGLSFSTKEPTLTVSSGGSLTASGGGASGSVTITKNK